MDKQINIFLQNFESVYNELAMSIPNIIGAILIILLGWVVAKILQKVFVKILKIFRINVLTEKSGADKFLTEGGIKFTLIALIGKLFYWIIMLIVIMSAMTSLGLTNAKELLSEIILYIPNIIVSIIIFLLGLYAAKFVSKSLAVALKNMDKKVVPLIEKISYYAIIILTVLIVFSQLNIAKEIVIISFLLILGAFCLAFGIAFGLGGKEFAAEIYKKLNKKK